jgi:hypothetical protein
VDKLDKGHRLHRVVVGTVEAGDIDGRETYIEIEFHTDLSSEPHTYYLSKTDALNLGRVLMGLAG